MRILLALLVLGILVFIHELGHFMAAKVSGMRVEKFSIGMGPAISSFRRGDTEYVLGAIPAGGFVSVAGIEPDDEEGSEDPRLYHNRSLMQRAFFAAAGPAMNILLTFGLLFGLYMIGGVSEPEPMDTVISQVQENSPAAAAGLRAGDRIQMVGDVEVSSWQEIGQAVQHAGDSAVQLTYSRENTRYHATLQPAWNETNQAFSLGILKEPVFKKHMPSAQEAATLSGRMTVTMATMIVDAVHKLVTRQADLTSETEGLTGPVGMVKVIDDSIANGFESVIYLMSVLSINLGIINLLPIPALDGSRLMFIFLEGIRGQRIDPEKESIVNFGGFVFLMLLMLYVTFNDISNLL